MGLERGGIHGSRYAGGDAVGHMFMTRESMTSPFIEVAQEDLTEHKIVFLDRGLERWAPGARCCVFLLSKSLTLPFSWPESE